MKCLATITSLMTSPPVSQRTGKSTTSGYCVTCRSYLVTWLHPDCSTTSQGGSGNNSGISEPGAFCLFSVEGCLTIFSLLPTCCTILRLWGEPVNLREQHDALEFFNSLVDSLDEALKALGHPAMLSKVLGGSFADQKICQGCPHRLVHAFVVLCCYWNWNVGCIAGFFSTLVCFDRYECEESFTTLNVDIRNHQNLLDSMEQYVKGDLLEGANAYHCEKCNKKVRRVSSQPSDFFFLQAIYKQVSRFVFY